jgi:hypothetical protein
LLRHSCAFFLAASGKQTFVLGTDRGDCHDFCHLLVQGCSSASDPLKQTPRCLRLLDCGMLIGLFSVGLLGGGFMLYALFQWIRDGGRNHNHSRYNARSRWLKGQGRIRIAFVIVGSETMPFNLNREMTQGPQENQMWNFRVTKTREGSAVEEMFDQQLPHYSVVRIFRDVLGRLPANGLGRDDVVEHWNALEPRLRAEIATPLPPDHERQES